MMDQEERRSKYLSYLEGFEEAQGKSFDELKSISLSDPSFAVRMNDHVKQGVLGDGLSVDDWTGIMAAGPPIQAVVDQQLPATKLTELLVNSSQAFYRDWLDRASGAIAEGKAEFTSSAQSFAANAYGVLQATESAVFSITPLPLKGTKSFVQAIATPLAVTAIASRIPGVDQVISTATHLGGSFFSTATTSIAGNAFAYFGNSFMDALPSGLGSHAIAGSVGGALDRLVLGAINVSSQAIGQVGTAVMMGNVVLKGGGAIVSQISQKGLGTLLHETSLKTSALIGRTRSFIKSIPIQLNAIKDKFMASQEQQPSQNGSGVEKALPVPPYQPQNNQTTQVETVLQSEPELPPKVGPDPVQAVDEPSVVTKSEIEKGYETSAQTLLGTLGIDPQYLKNAQIDINGETVFKLRNYNLETSKIDKEAHDMMQKAMSDPANLKGEVKISVGGQPIIHVKDGVVLFGQGRVKESAKVEISTPSQLTYTELSQNVKADGYARTKEIAQAAFALGMAKEAVLEVMKHDPEFKNIESISSDLNQKMLAQAESRATQAAQPQQQVKEQQPEREPVVA
jgi:hypothetical protein